jgi:hypothetical protein
MWDFIETSGNFLSQWFILWPMIIILVGLIALWLFIRRRQQSED